MQGAFLRFYVHEGHRHRGRPVWEWLLEEANRFGIRGGSAFRAVAGFGRHHVLHEAHFFELAGALTVEVEFIATEEEARRFLAHLEPHAVRLFYAQIPATFAILHPDPADPPAGG